MRRVTASYAAPLSALALLLVGTSALADEVLVRGTSASEAFRDPRLARLAEAAALGRAGEVERLLAGGVPVDGQGWKHWTPLAFAIMSDGASVEGVRALLEHGANPNHRIENGHFLDGWPIVITAARSGDARLLGLMLQHGANPNTREPVELEGAAAFPFEGDSLLILSVSDNEKVRALLRHGADVNVRPRLRPDFMGGETAAEAAAILGYLDVLELLVPLTNPPLDDIANALQMRRWSAEVEGRRMSILRTLRRRGACVYADPHNPQTPGDLLCPGKWKRASRQDDEPVRRPGGTPPGGVTRPTHE